jgi:hypothetical protein
MLKLIVAGVLMSAATLAALVGHAAPAPRSLSPGGPAIFTPSPRDQTFQLSDQQVTQALNQFVVGQPLGPTPLGPAALQRIVVTFRDGRIHVDGEARVSSATTRVSVTARGEVDDGRVIVTIDDMQAFGVPLPANARVAFQQSIQAGVDAEVASIPLRVKSISIEAGNLVVVGTPLNTQR